MPQGFYLHRSLHIGEKNSPEEQVSDSDLLEKPDPVIVLAEPGAGKTELLRSLANDSSKLYLRAGLFMAKNLQKTPRCLLIDAMDELPRISKEATQKVIAKASEVGAEKVIFASRASEWDDAHTGDVRGLFGREPTTARLVAFTPTEQQKLFEHFYPQENFAHFLAETKRFDLVPLLCNPQFLKIFSEAYLGADKKFKDKKSIFRDAIEQLAREQDSGRHTRDRRPAQELVADAQELFAKLLLSGATGVSTHEATSYAEFPYLSNLIKKTDFDLLNSGLFKPTMDTNQHEPVHRIIAEYGAACFLTKRMMSKGDDLLKPRRCFALIAPNGTVRRELRGLFGWVACLGDEDIQHQAIARDPYAILANGDPSQLLPSSKIALFKALKERSKDDPFFRQGDWRRSFSVSGFFTHDVFDQCRVLLSDQSDQTHLRQLMIELIKSAEASAHFVTELEELVCCQESKSYSPGDALSCLLADQNYNPRPLYDELIASSDFNQIKLAGEIMLARSELIRDPSWMDALFDQLCKLYPRRDGLNFSVGETFFIPKLIEQMDAPALEHHLDRLRKGLKCSCGAKTRYGCHCLDGRSKLMGRLLDHYCQIAPERLSPEKFICWTRGLVFRERLSAEQSQSVRFMVANVEFRRSVQWLMLGNCRTSAKIERRHQEFWQLGGHSGWLITQDDKTVIIERAFSKGNIPLWSEFFIGHEFFNRPKGPEPIRKMMRKHANENPDFMKVWALENRRGRQKYDEQRRKNRPSLRPSARERKMAKGNSEFVAENKSLIRSGRCCKILPIFAQLYLGEKNTICSFENPIPDDLIEDALFNFSNFIPDHFLSFKEFMQSRLQGEYLKGGTSHREYLPLEYELSASALASYRRNGSLDGWNHDALMVVKTNMSDFQKIDEKEKNNFTSEMNRILFPTPQEKETFLRHCIEPYLASSSHHDLIITNVDWLNQDETFAAFRGALPLEWLSRFPQMPHYALRQLFDLVVAYSRNSVAELVETRCTELAKPSEAIDDERLKQQREFWFVRGFFFTFEKTKDAWEEFFSKKETIFLFQGIVGFRGLRFPAGWPPLSARQISWLLLNYVEAWPKVPLPSTWSTDSPKEERAYRFIGDLCSFFRKCDARETIEEIDRFLDDPRFDDVRLDLLNARASKRRELDHAEFATPSPETVVDFFDKRLVATVEDFRAHIVEEIILLGSRLRNEDTTSLDVFYKDEKKQHVDENEARDRIVERLRDRFDVLDSTIQIERHMADGKRCDITFSKKINGVQKLVVVEVKGQWNSALFSAATDQLHALYSRHPDADGQGIYLVLWFGSDEQVAGKKTHKYQSASDLKKAIEKKLPDDLKTRIDVVILDLSR